MKLKKLSLPNHTHTLNPYIQISMNNNLYNYVFWHNTYEELWYAIPREQYTNFMSGYVEYEGVFKSKNIDTLIYIINNPHEIPNNAN